MPSIRHGALPLMNRSAWLLSADRTFYTNTPDGGQNGLKAARSIALLSYRNYKTYRLTQQEESDDSKVMIIRASSYQNYQGAKTGEPV